MSQTIYIVILVLAVLAAAYMLSEWLARRARGGRDDDPSMTG